MATKVAGLIRVSTLQQAGDDHASLATQRAAVDRICAQYNLELAHMIEYSDVSGASVLLAPEIQRLIELMMSRQIQGVIAREFSRLMRPESFSDYALLGAFADSRTMLYLPEGPIDFSDKMGCFMGTIRAAMAGLERREILERVWAAKEVKRRNKELAQGHVVLPVGVGYEKGRGFYYELKADLVRQAAVDFLAGNQNYNKLAEKLGVTPRGMHLILRNPIWTGYRVIDKKRDTSASGKYVRADGRQADRRKIARAENEIIRVKVIDKPLLTEEQFNALQQAMDLKQRKHWRSDPEYARRFIYNGFLVCAECGELIQTAHARCDYYLCKSRRSESHCTAKYMRREQLEATLGRLFAEQLCSRPFLQACSDELLQRAERPQAVSENQILKEELDRSRGQRGRVVDLFVEGKITKPDSDERLEKIDRSIRAAEAKLAECAPSAQIVGVDRLVDLLAPLGEWECWNREQKRQVLAALLPEIRVADYRIESLGLNPALFSNENTHTGRGSWQQRA
jgi:DNA invertase Pin-like site-specific DNA recombinase